MQSFELWKSAIMDQSVMFRKRIHKAFISSMILKFNRPRPAHWRHEKEKIEKDYDLVYDPEGKDEFYYWLLFEQKSEFSPKSNYIFYANINLHTNFVILANCLKIIEFS